MKEANLIVGTTNNAAISMSIKKVAEGLIRKGADGTDGVLNRIEMAFRAYDPCFGCATYAGPRQVPVEIVICGLDASVHETVRRLC